MATYAMLALIMSVISGLIFPLCSVHGDLVDGARIVYLSSSTFI